MSKEQSNNRLGRLTEIFALKIHGKIIIGYYEGDFIIHKKKIIVNRDEADI